MGMRSSSLSIQRVRRRGEHLTERFMHLAAVFTASVCPSHCSRTAHVEYYRPLLMRTQASSR
jgi:hypothetical protein